MKKRSERILIHPSDYLTFPEDNEYEVIDVPLELDNSIFYAVKITAYSSYAETKEAYSTVHRSFYNKNHIQLVLATKIFTNITLTISPYYTQYDSPGQTVHLSVPALRLLTIASHLLPSKKNSLT